MTWFTQVDHAGLQSAAHDVLSQSFFLILKCVVQMALAAIECLSDACNVQARVAKMLADVVPDTVSERLHVGHGGATTRSFQQGKRYQFRNQVASAASSFACHPRKLVECEPHGLECYARDANAAAHTATHERGSSKPRSAKLSFGSITIRC